MRIFAFRRIVVLMFGGRLFSFVVVFSLGEVGGRLDNDIVCLDITVVCTGWLGLCVPRMELREWTGVRAMAFAWQIDCACTRGPRWLRCVRFEHMQFPRVSTEISLMDTPARSRSPVCSTPGAEPEHGRKGQDKGKGDGGLGKGKGNGQDGCSKGNGKPDDVLGKGDGKGQGRNGKGKGEGKGHDDDDSWGPWGSAS